MTNLRTENYYWPTSEPTAGPSADHAEQHHELLSDTVIGGVILVGLVVGFCLCTKAENPEGSHSMNHALL